MKVHVTAEDIENGITWDCHKCPIALALRRASGKPLAACYDCVRDSLLKKQRAWPKKYQKMIARFMDLFDSEMPVKPFTFELRLK